MEQNHTSIRFKETNAPEFMNLFAEVISGKQTAVDEHPETDLIDHMTGTLYEFTDAVNPVKKKSTLLKFYHHSKITLQLPSVQLIPVL